MDTSSFILGFLGGWLCGLVCIHLTYKKYYKNIFSLLPGVTFENRLLVQVILALNIDHEIQISVDDVQYKVFKEDNEIKYTQIYP